MGIYGWAVEGNACTEDHSDLHFKKFKLQDDASVTVRLIQVHILASKMGENMPPCMEGTMLSAVRHLTTGMEGDWF